MWGTLPCALVDAAAFVGFFSFHDSLQVKVAAILIAAVSLVVAIVTGAARLWSNLQVDELVKSKDLGTILNFGGTAAAPTLTQAKLSHAYAAGQTVGAEVEQRLGPEMRKDVSPAERVQEAISEKDPSNFTDAKTAYSLRERIIFLRSVMVRLKSSLNAEVAAQVVKHICAEVGIPDKSYTDADTTRASWNLDITWAPAANTSGPSARVTSLNTLVALRAWTNRDEDNSEMVKEVSRRFKFIASRNSYRLFDSSERYQAHWNIVWN
jgi:hypothetical protein